jgi:hypothetical protein
VAGRGCHLLVLSLSGGEDHNQDLLCLECRLTPWRHMRLNCGSGLLAGELALPRCYLLLDGGLPSVGLCLMPPLTSVTSLEKEGSFKPWSHRPRGNCHHGLSGRSVLHPQCGCDLSERSPRVTPSGRGEAEAPIPAWRRKELFHRVPYHGLPWG